MATAAGPAPDMADMAKWSKNDWKESMVTEDVGFQFDFGDVDTAEPPQQLQLLPKPAADADEEQAGVPAVEATEDIHRILKIAMKTLPDTFCKSGETEEALADWKQKKRLWKKAVTNSHKRYADGEGAAPVRGGKRAKAGK